MRLLPLRISFVTVIQGGLGPELQNEQVFTKHEIDSLITRRVVDPEQRPPGLNRTLGGSNSAVVALQKPKGFLVCVSNSFIGAVRVKRQLPAPPGRLARWAWRTPVDGGTRQNNGKGRNSDGRRTPNQDQGVRVGW